MLEESRFTKEKKRWQKFHLDKIDNYNGCLGMVDGGRRHCLWWFEHFSTSVVGGYLEFAFKDSHYDSS